MRSSSAPAIQNDSRLPASTSAEAVLQRAEAQDSLFAPTPKRIALRSLTLPASTTQKRVAVLRNVPFEFCMEPLKTFLQYGGCEAEFIISDYDDSLSAPLPVNLDAVLIWLDPGRYDRALADGSFGPWLQERMLATREQTNAPILVIVPAAKDEPSRLFGEHASHSTQSVSGCRLFSLEQIATDLGSAFRDRRMTKVAGYDLSDLAYLRIARELGLAWLPAMFGERIKAIVLDLDNTLYDGVLGEAGVDEVSLSDEHVALQKELLRWRDTGIFLAVASKNDATDVDALFSSRTDFPLKVEAFSVVAANWSDKATSIDKIAQLLRIGMDAVLFVDDNPGELAAVASAHPSIKTLHASSAAQTLRALMLFPGLRRWTVDSSTDVLRVNDADANRERERRLQNSANVEEYLASLGIRLDMYVDDAAQRERIFELSQKTNQFNLSLARYTEAEVQRNLTSPEWIVVTASLRDRLSDSGVIATLHARLSDDEVIVEDLCISCRALGRHIEDVIVSEAARKILTLWKVSNLGFRCQTGPRNAPALKWLEAFIGEELGGRPKVTVPNSVLKRIISDKPTAVAVHWCI